MCYFKHSDFENSVVDSDEEEIDDYDDDEEQFDPNAHMIEFEKAFGRNTDVNTSANENPNSDNIEINTKLFKCDHCTLTSRIENDIKKHLSDQDKYEYRDDDSFGKRCHFRRKYCSCCWNGKN